MLEDRKRSTSRIFRRRQSEEFRRVWSPALLTQLAVIVILTLVAVHWATRPLSDLAGAAEKIGTNVDSPPLAESGPTEVRDAARAFNRMQCGFPITCATARGCWRRFRTTSRRRSRGCVCAASCWRTNS
jgi:HAMP domain-containing protein